MSTSAGLPSQIRVIPLPTPFPVGTVNVVLLEGDPLVLLDTGPLWPGSREALVRELAALGYRPSDLDLVVLSHRHCDHLGLAPWLESEGAQVIAHHEALPWLSQAAHHTGRVDLFTTTMTRAGAPPDLAAGALAFDHWSYAGIGPVQRPQPVREGDLLRLGSRDWRVLEMPGHCHTQLVLLDEQTGVALGGDHLLAHISSNALIDVVLPCQVEPIRPLGIYRRSLDRMAELPISTVVTGHGEVVTDHKPLIVARQQETEKRLGSILRRITPEGSTAAEILHRLFGPLPENQYFFGISEVLGHLFLLEDRHAVRRVRDGAVERWELVTG